MTGRREDSLPRFVLSRTASLAVLAVALAASLSCTSSGDGGIAGTNDHLNRGVSLEPLPGTPSPLPLTRVELVERAGDATTSCIGVKVWRANELFAAAFSVTYDPTVLRYTGFDASASCLGTGTLVLPPRVDATATPGRIVVGLTRNAATTSVGVNVIEDYLIDLCFEVVATGEFDMNFVGNLALLKLDGTPIDNLGSNWVGMHVVVKQ